MAFWAISYDRTSKERYDMFHEVDIPNAAHAACSCTVEPLGRLFVNSNLIKMIKLASV